MFFTAFKKLNTEINEDSLDSLDTSYNAKLWSLSFSNFFFLNGFGVGILKISEDGVGVGYNL